MSSSRSLQYHLRCTSKYPNFKMSEEHSSRPCLRIYPFFHHGITRASSLEITCRYGLIVAREENEQLGPVHSMLMFSTKTYAVERNAKIIHGSCGLEENTPAVCPKYLSRSVFASTNLLISHCSSGALVIVNMEYVGKENKS